MRRALVSPVLSVAMPGLGQLVNRQPGKGAALVLGAGLVFLGVFGVFLHKLNLAWVQVSGLDPARQTMESLSQALWDQGVASLAALLGLYVAMVIYAAVDAARWGRRLDAAPETEA
jgi:hypothetical protein